MDARRGPTAGSGRLRPPESSDADLADLFREVSLGVTPEVAELSVVLPSGEPSLIRSRDTLSLPKVLQETGIRRWRRVAGEPRPTSEVMSLFSNRDLVHVIIRDPYCIARHKGRFAQIEFLKQLGNTANSLGGVTIEYAPEADGDVEESQARRDFASLFSSAFSSAAKVSMVRRGR